ncbi:hypothetical protein [Phytohabitans suffuscus]|uniref:Uncharacterized protein n=1 Tax=Phytohabitans suffuscus TaxID=624315 RepID=A0A6F8YPC6_9ACTN|nr:hypothetical protein [Phytohabitans suffuscus]BCB88025.1 hypothetical protein Psuf_053380 [Phytohabitans suffuscus]
MREGRCHGGPLDGQVRTTRCPDGFLLGDKPTERAWFYDWRDGAFQLREPEPEPFTETLEVGYAMGQEYDVLALPDPPADAVAAVEAAQAMAAVEAAPDAETDEFTILASNPNPGRISTAIWRLWSDFDRFEPSALLGGVYAAKPGYHNYRNALPSSDYSVRDLAADRQGSGVMASALDLSLSDAAMRKYTGRLDSAARSRDPRLYTPRGPVLREFIGTKDSRTVYCYVLVGGRPLGVGADAGPDPGRDKTHLWHIHLSIVRQFCEDWSALDGVLSVLRGESLAAWRSRSEYNEMTPQQAQQLRDAHYTTAVAIPNPTGDGKVPLHVWAGWMTGAVKALATAVGNVDEATKAQLQQDLTSLQAGIDAVPEQVVRAFGPSDDPEDIALRLRAMLGDKATAVGQILARG